MPESWVWQCTCSVILSLGRLRQEYYEFEASLRYTAWPYLKKKKIK